MQRRVFRKTFRKKPLVKWHSSLLTWGGIPLAVTPNVASAVELLNTGERGATQALSVLADNQVEARINVIRGSLYFENDSPSIAHTISWGIIVDKLRNNTFPAAVPDPQLLPDSTQSWMWVEMLRLMPNSAARAGTNMFWRDVHIKSRRRLKPGETCYIVYKDTPDNGTDNSVVWGLNLRTLITRLD